jgi:hypothetical protein
MLLIRATLADLAKDCNTGTDYGNTPGVENVSTLLVVAIDLEDLVGFCMISGRCLETESNNNR